MKHSIELLILKIDIIFDHQYKNENFHREAKKSHNKTKPMQKYLRILSSHKNHIIEIGKNPQKVIKNEQKQSARQVSVTTY